MASYSSAVNGLRGHHEAVKPSTWLGYVYRFDAWDFSSSKSYVIGDEVMYDGTHYVCRENVGPGAFDPAKWSRASTGVAYHYQLIFVENKEFDGTGSTHSGVGKDGFTAYRITVTVNESNVRTYADPVCMKTRESGASQAGDYDQFYDDTTSAGHGVFPIDSVLFSGFLADNWSLGTKEDFDTLAAGSNRW